MIGFTMPANPVRLWIQLARLGIDAQTVIGLRTAGMMGIMAQSPGEPFRMVAEKQAAAAESLFAMLEAAGRGASPERVMVAALRPYGKRTRANSRRLTLVR